MANSRYRVSADNARRLQLTSPHTRVPRLGIMPSRGLSMRLWLPAALVISSALGCTSDEARARQEAWSAFTDLEERAPDHWAAWTLAFSVAEVADRALTYAARADGLEPSEEEFMIWTEGAMTAFADCQDRGESLDVCEAWQEWEVREDTRERAEDERRKTALPDAWKAREAARAAFFAAQEKLEAAAPDAWAKWEAADTEFLRVDPDRWDSARNARAQVPLPIRALMADGSY